MRFLDKAGRIFDMTINVMLVLSGIIVLFAAAAVAQDVIIRKTLNFTWAPLYEILTYCLVWMTFLGTTAIYRDNGHVRLDSFMLLLPRRARRIIDLLTSCSAVLLCALLFYLTARLNIYDFLTDFRLASILNPPKWPIEIIIPISFLLMFIQAIRHSVRCFKAVRSGGPPEPAE